MKPRTAAIALISATAIAILAVMAVRVFSPAVASVDVDPARFPVRGIDISAHNGSVDFDSVARAGISFVYIKASEGASWRDSRFNDNYERARRAGLAVGLYHFFRFDIEGWRQSVNFLLALRGRPLDLPVAIDVEEWGNPGEFTTEIIIDNLRSMVELLRQGGREPIIYTNKNGYYRFIRGHFDDVALWICSFTDPPLAERDRWTLWQHSHLGRVPGIRGDVDLNTFNTPARGNWKDYLASRPAVARLEIRRDSIPAR